MSWHIHFKAIVKPLAKSIKKIITHQIKAVLITLVLQNSFWYATGQRLNFLNVNLEEEIYICFTDDFKKCLNVEKSKLYATNW